MGQYEPVPPPRWKPRPPASRGRRWIGEPERAAITVNAFVGVVIGTQEVLEGGGVDEVSEGGGPQDFE